MKSLCDEICLRLMKSKLCLDEIKSTKPTDKVDFIPPLWDFIVKRFILPVRVDLVAIFYNDKRSFVFHIRYPLQIPVYLYIYIPQMLAVFYAYLFLISCNRMNHISIRIFPFFIFGHLINAAISEIAFFFTNSSKDIFT